MELEHERRRAPLDRRDLDLGGRQRQERHDLAEVALELIAQVLDRGVDVPGNQRGAELLSRIPDRGLVHRPTLRGAGLQQRYCFSNDVATNITRQSRMTVAATITGSPGAPAFGVQVNAPGSSRWAVTLAFSVS